MLTTESGSDGDAGVRATILAGPTQPLPAMRAIRFGPRAPEIVVARGVQAVRAGAAEIEPTGSAAPITRQREAEDVETLEPAGKTGALGSQEAGPKGGHGVPRLQPIRSAHLRQAVHAAHRPTRSAFEPTGAHPAGQARKRV